MTPAIAAGQAFVVLVLGAAAVSKAGPRSGFREFISALGELPLVSRHARQVALGVVSAEALIALLAAVPWTARAGLLLASALFLAFSLFVAFVVRQGKARRCACFGAGSTKPMSYRHALRNLCVAGALLVSVVVPYDRTAGPTAFLLASFAGMFSAILFLAAEHLNFLFGPNSS